MATTEQQRVVVISRGREEGGKTGIDYVPGISTETAGATQLCLQLGSIPAGARAKAHYHEHESAVLLVRGEIVTWFGDGLGEHAVVRAGELVFIPARVPHLPVNYGDEPAEFVIARGDPRTLESSVLLPELDDLPHTAGRPS
jgi:uncharacterized RmlC-like cupin family protein